MKILSRFKRFKRSNPKNVRIKKSMKYSRYKPIGTCPFSDAIQHCGSSLDNRLHIQTEFNQHIGFN